MSIKQAVASDKSIVKTISEITISEIYPHYYPKGTVDFFLNYHNEENILKDIEMNRVFLCFDQSQKVIGTVTIKENEICQLFVLPAYQGIGYGTKMLDFAEKTIFNKYLNIVLDASLPAKKIYLKRGYKDISFNIIASSDNDFLRYDVMEKKK
ncbi:MAG: GNAT family N-acetyltransferase [Beduini sp.]|uniref:GNAT family N-acetyltransferase n=1 Tax=Beduini sp. TaxID=1922300 RepID=UPI00399081FA